jgi:hypothetical protein
MIQWPLPGSDLHATMEVLLQVVFSMWSAPRLNHAISRMQCSGASWLVSEGVSRGLLQFSPCELLLLGAANWGTGIVQVPRVWETSTIGSLYQALTQEDLVRAGANCRVCELVIVLELLVVVIRRWSINPITNPKPIYSHAYMWQYKHLHINCTQLVHIWFLLWNLWDTQMSQLLYKIYAKLTNLNWSEEFCPLGYNAV